MSDDNIGGLDEGPLQVGVALFDHPSVVGPSGTRTQLWDQTAVVGEALGFREAVNGADFAIDHDGQNLSGPRDRLN